MLMFKWIKELFICPCSNHRIIGTSDMFLGDIKIGHKTMVQCTRCKKITQRSYLHETKKERLL